MLTDHGSESQFSPDGQMIGCPFRLCGIVSAGTKYAQIFSHHDPVKTRHRALRMEAGTGEDDAVIMEELDLGRLVDVGVSGTVRQNPGGRSYAGTGGPTIGISPMNNTYIAVGYNVVGFHDRDFEASRYTRSGPFVTVRLKFDQNSFSALGLGRR